MKTGLTFKDYNEAIEIQDACNLSGVVHAFSNMMNKIWDEARKLNKGTDWVNTHPIVILFTEKCVHLATGQTLTGDKINEAWEECEKKRKGKNIANDLTPADYDYCPFCHGSFSFTKPNGWKCPWCKTDIRMSDRRQ